MKKILAVLLMGVSLSAIAADGWVMDLKGAGRIIAYNQPCTDPVALSEGLVARGVMQSPKGTDVEVCWAYSDNPEVVDGPSIIVYASGHWLAFATHLFKPFSWSDI